MSPVPIILDTDPGVDDAMAIFYALAEPEIELLGLTTVFGNVAEPVATLNALALLALAESDVPVASGAGVPRVQDPPGDATHVHGANGLGGIDLPEPVRDPDPRAAADFLAATCAARPGEVTIVAVGPLTNLAAALDKHPDIAGTAARVVVMGGAVRRRGNVTPHAEANIWQDPHAAARVLAADWPVTLVGLDVTERVTCTAADLAPMAAASPRCGTALLEAARFYFDFHARVEGLDGCHLHDPTAVIAAIAPELFETVETPLAVTLDGPEAGRTREAPGAGPPVSVCLGQATEAIRQRFVSALASGRLP